ncbi:hypothetical protein Hanom_Chr14g01316481 [Helianthus anomalus]
MSLVRTSDDGGKEDFSDGSSGYESVEAESFKQTPKNYLQFGTSVTSSPLWFSTVRPISDRSSTEEVICNLGEYVFFVELGLELCFQR